MSLTGNFRKMVMFNIKRIMNAAGNKHWVEFSDKFDDKCRKIYGFLSMAQCKVCYLPLNSKFNRFKSVRETMLIEKKMTTFERWLCEFNCVPAGPCNEWIITNQP